MGYGELKGFKDRFGYGGIAPDFCANMQAVQDLEDNSEIRLTWNDPNDTIIEGKLLASWKKTTIVRKYGSYPIGLTDGKKILENTTRNQYMSEPYVDNDFVVGEDPHNYYYAAFPESDSGAVSVNEANRFVNRIYIPYVLYGFKIDNTNSDPASRVTYLEDNAEFTPAKMNLTTHVMNYGSWANAFFMPRPCMLKFDGTVDYYLNPNNYGEKLEGGASDYRNINYAGNVMIEFPTIWFKRERIGNFDYVYISDQQVDDNFECYAHRDRNGAIMPYTYVAAYNGQTRSFMGNDKLMSLSNVSVMHTQTAADEITYAKNNGEDWYTEVLADRLMINDLLVLIGRSTNMQETFGYGYYSGGSSASNLVSTGVGDTYGLFWGSDGTNHIVKVFGIEHYWGHQWRRIVGWINANSTQKIKLTRGTYDGSTATDYNLDGSGYITLTNATPGGTSGGYISDNVMTEYGRFPKTASGSETTYECDGLWFNNSQVNYAFVGGGCGSGLKVGAFYSNLNNAASNSDWDIGAALSCKPTVAA